MRTKAVHKQKTVEQERRSMRLPVTGEFEAAFLGSLPVIVVSEHNNDHEA